MWQTGGIGLLERYSAVDKVFKLWKMTGTENIVWEYLSIKGVGGFCEPSIMYVTLQGVGV